MIEIAVASSLFIVLLLSVLQTLDSGTRNEAAQRARDEALVDLRTALNRVSRDIRPATFVAPACPATPRCSSASKIDVDTLIGGDVAPHRVVIEVTGGEIRRSLDGGPASVLATRVTTSSPFCYNMPECPWSTTPDPPTTVRVTFALTPIAFDRGAITLATEIDLRNL